MIEREAIVKIRGNPNLVQRISGCVQETFKVIRGSYQIPNDNDPGVHTFLTILEEEG